MNDGAAPLWSDDQRDWLQALGHVVYVQAADATAAPAEQARHEDMPAASAPAVDEMPAAVPAGVGCDAPLSVPAPVPLPDDGAEAGFRRAASAPPPPVIDTPEPPERRGGFARRPAPRLPDRLQIALLRASGCNPNLPETQGLIDSWPLAELRADPQAKRRLWPQLRALRRAAADGKGGPA